MKSIYISLLLLCTITIKAQTHQGVCFQFKLESNKGLSGNMLIFHDSLGMRSELDASVNSGFRIKKTSLVKKNEPNMVYQLDEVNHTYSTVEVSHAAEYGSEPAEATVIGIDSIDNYVCKHVIVKQGGKLWEIWTTTSIVEYSQYAGVMNKQQYIGNTGVQKALEAAGAQGFPIKTKLTEKATTTTTTLIEITHQSLSDKLFEIPSDYKPGGSSFSPWGKK